MNWFTAGMYHAAMMAWETAWALTLGFAVSAALQVFASKNRMTQYFGRADLRSMALATGLGAASSSCSYAAAAAGRSAFRQGAALLPAMAFMFASTNLVIELGAVLWVLMGWRFVVAEVIGALVLIGLLWLLSRLIFPKDLEAQARAHTEASESGASDCCHHDHGAHDHAHGSPHGAANDRWKPLADAFVADWQMLWKEIAIGFLLAGFLAALVPAEGWKALFLQNGPHWLQLLENAVVGPLIAVASFVCSVGNIPLASVLWSGGISFGGVISFIYADLIIVPLVLIYRKYYGARPAMYLTLVFFLAMVGSGIIVDLLFDALGWLPKGPRPPSAVMQAHFQWNYTTWLDLVALGVGSVLIYLHLRPASSHRTEGHAGADHERHHDATTNG